MASGLKTGYRPSYVVCDFETSLDGVGSVDYWHPRFRVDSAAFSWLAEDGAIRSEFVEGENAVRYFLERIVDAGIPLVAHNVSFEMGVTQCRYPELAARVVWHADTMRLVQNYDNGGDAFAAPLPLTIDEQLDRLEDGAGDDEDEARWIGGLGLANVVQRILNLPDHKTEAYAWLAANLPECKGKPGQYLNRLPRDVLERYNCFSGVTRFITSRGLRSFEELGDGAEVYVWTRSGWKLATVRNYGEQATYALTVSRGKVKRVIETTGDHKWFCEENRKYGNTAGTRTTVQLRKNDRLTGAWPTAGNVDESAIGRGIVFGDGTRCRNKSRVVLIDHKRELARFFPPERIVAKTKTTSTNRWYFRNTLVDGLPLEWKRVLPSEDSSDAYLRGFIAGWLATDGSVSRRGEIRITAKDEHAIAWLWSAAHRLGLPVTQTKAATVRSEWSTGTFYTLTFTNCPQIQALVVLGKHRDRLQPVRQALYWKVDSITPTGRTVAAWCVEEPATRTFTLEGGILTHNCGDTEMTLRLYEFLVAHFASLGYDWRLDHLLYFSSVRYVVGAKIRGVRVDREALAAYSKEVEEEIDAIGRAFHDRFAEHIRVVERARLLVQILKRKTLRGRKGFVRSYRMGKRTAVKEVKFNVGSNKQLAALFVDVLRMVPKFKTDKGQPSFRSAVLGQWGDGGEMLKTRRKRMLVFKQASALLELSEFDGRWHLEIKVAAAATGRMAGGAHAA